VKDTEQPLDIAFVEAGAQAGYALTDDVNGYRQEGFGKFDMNVDRGRRASTSQAYLRPARRRANLMVDTGALAHRIVFEGRRAVGVAYEHRGALRQARAEREVILSSGAFGSPQLLLLSGVGPVDDLTVLDIPVVADLPGVGRNLHDHLEVHLLFEAASGATFDPYLRPHRKALIGLRWFLFKDGICASNRVEVGAFIRSRAGIRHPDVQYHFWPFFLDGWAPSGKRNGFCMGVGTLRATSRGQLTLRTSDPRDEPLIDPNYLATEEDRVDLRRCVELTRELAGQAAFEPFRATEVDPGPSVRSAAEIDAYVRRSSESAFHPCGTCKMGDDYMAVVDPERPAGRRRLDHAQHHQRQPERPGHDDGREGRRHDPRPPAPRTLQRARPPGRGLADGAALTRAWREGPCSSRRSTASSVRRSTVSTCAASRRRPDTRRFAPPSRRNRCCCSGGST
jgi:choline dehydrogenase